MTVYGKQLVRFAESLEFDNQEALQMRLVQDVGVAAGAAPTGVYGTKIWFDGVSAGGGEVVGVNQFSIPAVNQADASELAAEPRASRIGSVANSGLLLIEADEVNPPAVGTPINGKTDGTVDDGTNGYLVTYNGGDVLVREVVQIGGTTHVLTSWV